VRKGKSIIFSTVPTIPIYVAGSAVYKPAKGTSLKRIINTRRRDRAIGIDLVRAAFAPDQKAS